MKKILVTGAKGQLAQCIKDIAKDSDAQFTFVDRTTFDLSNTKMLQDYAAANTFDICINTAAYTNVEKAESDVETAYAVNAKGVEALATICNENNALLIHISTDYVFDGSSTTPYVETDATNPINVYGASKLAGEKAVTTHCKKHYILRTSWLYSQYGHNFLNTVLRKANAKESMTVTTEQTGTPTNANDLAAVIMQIMHTPLEQYGIYHCSNSGSATWYDFARKIVAYSNFKDVMLAKIDHYPTFAKRPEHSVLNCDKLVKHKGITLPEWDTSLKQLVSKITA